MEQLTDRQRKIYDFIAERIRAQHWSPTIRDIAFHFGIKSPNGVMYHINALERKGWITRESNLARAISLTNGNASQEGMPLFTYQELYDLRRVDQILYQFYA